MAVQIICGTARIDVQPLLVAISDFRSGAMEVMRSQERILEGDDLDAQQELVTSKAKLAGRERDLVAASVAALRSIQKAKF